MKIPERRKAVAPVIATLLMIAVAVAMSVIIFMWSQGFLSQTSSSTGGQQGAQNQAAQSSIAIESGTFTTGGTTASATLIIRNVGAVTVNLGSVSVTGISSNGPADFTGSIIASFPLALTTTALTSTDATWVASCTSTGATGACTGANIQAAKGGAVTIALTVNAGTPATTQIKSGDIINIEVTTNVGTFAQSQFTVP